MTPVNYWNNVPAEEDLDEVFDVIVSRLGKPGRMLPGSKKVHKELVIVGNGTPLWYGDIDYSSDDLGSIQTKFSEKNISFEIKSLV